MTTDQMTTVDESDRIAECRALEGLHRLLGRVVESEVDRDLLTFLRGDLREGLAESGVTLPADVLEEAPEVVLETLAEEYTALFVAPGAISPYASVFLHGALYKAPADRALMAYRKAGFDFHRVHSGEFPDHVGVMLTFLGNLYGAEADALEAGGAAGITPLEGATAVREHRNRFLLDDMAHWVPAWTGWAEAAAQHEFYAAMLRLMRQVMWAEIEAAGGPEALRRAENNSQREPQRMATDHDYRKASGL